ncbi:MAG TPA: hypothetical protein VGC67_02910 [Cellulomonas sp.]
MTIDDAAVGEAVAELRRLAGTLPDTLVLDLEDCGSATAHEAASTLSWSLTEQLLAASDDLAALAAEADVARADLAAVDRALAGDA